MKIHFTKQTSVGTVILASDSLRSAPYEATLRRELEKVLTPMIPYWSVSLFLKGSRSKTLGEVDGIMVVGSGATWIRVLEFKKSLCPSKGSDIVRQLGRARLVLSVFIDWLRTLRRRPLGWSYSVIVADRYDVKTAKRLKKLGISVQSIEEIISGGKKVFFESLIPRSISEIESSRF